MAVRSLPVLYMTDLSPPVRSVLLTARVLGISLKRKEVNLAAGDNHNESYIEKNPQGTVPMLEDSDCVIWDSSVPEISFPGSRDRVLAHAISSYLVNKYGKDDKLYPQLPRKKAIVDQCLHFDSGIVYPEFRNIVYPIIFGNRDSINRSGVNRVYKVYESVNSILENGKSKWLAGDEMTIADICNVTTISTLEVFTPSTERFHHLDMWLNRCKSEIPGYREANQRGLDRLVKLIKAKLASSLRS